jgi:hypothetical protein
MFEESPRYSPFIPLSLGRERSVFPTLRENLPPSVAAGRFIVV